MLRKTFKATLSNRRFRFRQQKTLPELYAEVDVDEGWCSVDPIINDRSQEFQAELLIHEALHVLAPEWKELRVLNVGKDLARLLVTSGVIDGSKKKKV